MQTKPLHYNQSPPYLSGEEIIQREKIINYGSGTSLETLMQPAYPDDTVLNIDTGHMLLAEIIVEFFNRHQEDQLGGIKDIVQKVLEADANGVRERIASDDIHALKHDYFSRVLGHEGVMEQVGLMEVPARETFLKRASALPNFRLGDSRDLECDASVDKIYVINGYGYSPLTDETIFVPMAKTLKPGGQIIIISELMGPTVKPFLNFSRGNRDRDLTPLFYSSREETVIRENPDPSATFNHSSREVVYHLERDEVPLNTVFDHLRKRPEAVPALALFDYDHTESAINVSKSFILRNDRNTEDLETRHTEGGGELKDTFHVRLVLTKR